MDFRNISPLLIIVILSILRNTLNRRAPSRHKQYRKRDIEDNKTLSKTKEEGYNTAYQNQDYNKYEHKKKAPKSYKPTIKKDIECIENQKEDEELGKGMIIDKNLIINGIIMSEVLGAPRAKKPYTPPVQFTNKRA